MLNNISKLHLICVAVNRTALFFWSQKLEGGEAQRSQAGARSLW